MTPEEIEFAKQAKQVMKFLAGCDDISITIPARHALTLMGLLRAGVHLINPPEDGWIATINAHEGIKQTLSAIDPTIKAFLDAADPSQIFCADFVDSEAEKPEHGVRVERFCAEIHPVNPEAEERSSTEEGCRYADLSYNHQIELMIDRIIIAYMGFSLAKFSGVPVDEIQQKAREFAIEENLKKMPDEKVDEYINDADKFVATIQARMRLEHVLHQPSPEREEN